MSKIFPLPSTRIELDARGSGERMGNAGLLSMKANLAVVGAKDIVAKGHGIVSKIKG